MKLLKSLIDGIDIDDPIYFCHDTERNVLNILRERYEGKCFVNCFVEKIERINWISPCTINQEGAPGFGTVIVDFVIQGLHYKCKDLINGCEVMFHSSVGMCCRLKNIDIVVKKLGYYENVEDGSLISLRVSKVDYFINKQRINMVGEPFKQLKGAKYFRVSVVSNLTGIDEIMKSIEFERGQIAKYSNSNIYEKIKRLMYAYKEVQSDPVGSVRINIMDLVKGPEQLNGIKVVAFDAKIHPLDACVYGYTSDEGITTEVETDWNVIYYNLVYEFYSQLKFIREWCEIHSANDYNIKNDIIWHILAMEQI